MTHDHLMTHLEHMLPSSQRLAASLGAPLETTTTKDGHNPTAPPETPTGSPMGRRQRPPVSSCWCCAATTIKTSSLTRDSTTTTTFPIMCLCINVIVVVVVVFVALVVAVSSSSSGDPISSGRPVRIVTTTTTSLNETPAPMAVIAEALAASPITSSTANTSLITTTTTTSQLRPLPLVSPSKSSDTPPRHADHTQRRTPRRGLLLLPREPTASQSHPFEVKSSSLSPNVLAKRSNADYDDDTSSSSSSSSSSWPSSNSTSSSSSDDGPAGPASTRLIQDDSSSDAVLETSEDDDQILRDEIEFRRRLIDQSWQTTSSSSANLGQTSPSKVNQTTGARLHDQENNNNNADGASFVASFFSHIDKQWKFAEIVLIIVISAILNLVTIVGNIMVLISFKMDRSLQTVSNYFLLSLALADLLIGLISMPLYTLYLLLNYWPLGALMCDIWLAIDYLNSNAAVLNMLIISFDRYFSVTRPLTYRAKRTTKHAILMISFAWILSLTIWTPAIFTYPYYKGRTVQGTDKCEIEFVKANTYLTFVTAILAFYIPVAIMIYLYWRIWLETKKRYRDLTTLFLVSGVGAAAPSRPTRPPPSSLTSGSGPASTVVSSSTGAPTSGVGLYAASGRSLAKSLGARLGGGCGSGGPHEFMGTGRRRTSAGSVTTTTTGGGAPSAATANATKTGAPRDPRGPPASTTTTTSASSLPMPQRDNGHCRHESSPPTRPCGRSPDVEQQLQMKSNGDPGKPPSDGSASSQTVLPVTGFIGKLKAVDGLQSIGAGSKTTGEQPIAKCATDSQCGCPVACSTTGHTKSSTSPSLSAAAHQHPSMSAKSVCRLCQQQEGPAHCVGSIGKRNKSASRANCCCCYSSAPAKTTTSSSLSSALASQIQKNRAGGSSSKNCCYCSSSTCSCCCGNVNYQAGARTATATTKTTTLNAPKQPVQDAMKPASKSNQIAYQDFETDEQKQPVTTGASNSNNVKCQKSGSKSSLYQLIADAASSSHQRSKIHPTATSEQQLASSNHRHRTRPGDDEDDDGNSSGTDDDDDDDDDDQEEEEDDDEDEKDEVANRKLKDPDQQDSTELKGEQPTKSRRECLLVDVATSPINFPAAAAFGEEKQQQQRQRHGINLDRLGQASVPVAPPPVSPLSPEREDFETRIVSYGDKFTFETNDPKLVGQAALGGPGATGSGTGTGAGGSGQSGSKQRCCRSHGHHSGHRHNHQQGAPATSRSGSNAHHNRHHHHHHHHLPPSGTGRQASGCHCADVISAHDAECRFCGPSGKPEQPQQRLVNHQNQNSAHHHHTQTHTHHPYHHHHHHHHNHHGQKHHHHHHHNHHHHNQHHLAATRQSHRLTDCKRCFQQQQQQRPPPPSPVPNKMLAPSSGGHEAGQGSNNKKLYKQNIKQEQALAGLAVVGPITKVSAAPASDHGGSLPILNALQQQQKHQASESGGLPGPPGNRSTRSGKKFSQKLTFSDILIERSNSCVTIESDHQQQQQGASSAKSSVNGDGGVRSSKKGAAGPASGASQDIVKRNADRLRSAFDDDELDEDNDDQELTSGRAKPAPQSLAGQSWLKCLFMDMFQSRNRPVRYKTNYRGPGATNDDQPTDHQRESARRARWIDSLCCSRAQTSGPILKCSSPRTSDELSAYQRDQPTDSSTNSMNEQQQQQHHHQHQHHQQKGGTSSQHSSTSSSKAQQCHHYHPIQPKSERKAAKTLSTLLLVFIVTWLPYNVLVLIKTLSGGEDQVPEKIWNFSYYLCYINSTINPLCYALCNAQFRRTYMRILKCKLSNEHNSTRRLVPIQSSSTWNKDLKLNSTTSPNTDCSGTNSNTSHQHQHGQHLQVHLQQVARTAERTRPRAGQARKNTSSSDSSTGNHRLR